MKQFKILIPKYTYDIKDGKAVKELSRESLSIYTTALTKEDAVISVLIDLGIVNLNYSGYCLDNIEVKEDVDSNNINVQIEGVK